ncbi:MAG: ATP-binding protein [Gammaproteobacteria bacterium]|nr:ATP-binding protein [Gammaproteobacteria bacterium]MDH5614278.1 ATP-binding protein [Gammaproteobacteria bacterium]
MAKSKKIIELEMASDPALLSMMRCVVLHASMNAGCNNEQAENMVIAVNEACMNIIQHAYNNDVNNSISLQVYEESNKLVFRLIDHGNPFDVSKIKKRNLDEVRPGGLGLPMIETIMDKVDFFSSPEGNENILELVKIKH